jgi:hypothetical protein
LAEDVGPVGAKTGGGILHAEAKHGDFAISCVMSPLSGIKR